MVQALGGETDRGADLIIAADALVYLGDLAPLLSHVARVLSPGGLFAFTVEAHAGEGFTLGAGLRYGHSPSYLRQAIVECGLTLRDLSPASTRTDGGVPVPGFVVVASQS
jgi:predicted TPR repeat methyltransferase